MVCCARDRDFAVEVLQETYCRILSGDTTFSGKSEFSTWLFGVIRNVAYEEARRRRKRSHTESMTIAETAVVDCSGANSEQLELTEQLDSAMAKLSPRQREMLHLTFYEGMTVEQAANVLGISIGSGRQHYQRGKAALRRVLSADREFTREQ